MLAVWDQTLWFDGRLALSSKREVSDRHPPFWVGPRHVVREKNYEIDLVDLDRPEKPVHLALGLPNSVFYEPTLHRLAVYSAPLHKVEQFEIDLDHLTIKTLATLDVSPDLPTEGQPRIDLLEPARADGVSAIVRWYGHKTYQADRTHIAIFRDTGAADNVIRSSRELVVAEALAVDATGTMYVRDKANGPILARRDGKPDVTLGSIVATKLFPSHDGALLAALHDNDLSVFDATGLEKWRHTIWNLTQVVFTSDGYVVARSDGGLVSFDAATGTQVAAACAFDFGLHDGPIPTYTLNAQPVCEGPP
jgi:hypothetical protein